MSLIIFHMQLFSKYKSIFNHTVKHVQVLKHLKN